jgi:hypothetical protein
LLDQPGPLESAQRRGIAAERHLPGV